MKINHKSDLQKLRDSIDIYRISDVQRKIKNASDLCEIPLTKQKEKIRIIGLDEYLKKR